MKRGVLASVFGLIGLVAVPAGAQTMPPGQMNQPLPGTDPYASPAMPNQDGAYPPSDDDPNLVDPNMVDPGAADPNAYAPPDLGPDNEIAQTYDDGYDPQAYTQFQDALTPYGTWDYDQSYGQVWTPTASIVGANFVPYANGGHWIRSEYGWTWASDWNWGWAPFHYGRWTTRAGRWSWVPGTMWGPSWVAWRTGGGYVGWAPLPPRGVRLAAWTHVGSPWRFTRASSLGAPRPSFVSSRYLPGLFARTTVVSSDRLLTHGNWRVHVNAGPLRAAFAPEVPLARAAPTALPRTAVYPRAGVPVYERPWVRGPEAGRDPLTSGWRAGMPVVSTHGTFRPAAPYGGGTTVGRGTVAPASVGRPSPSFAAPAYGRPAPNFAGHPSAGASLSFAPHPGYQPPVARTFVQPSRPAYQPPAMHTYSPAPRPFTPAPSGGGFHSSGSAPSSGGFHGSPGGGGFQAPSGGGFSHFGGGGGAHFGGGGGRHR